MKIRFSEEPWQPAELWKRDLYALSGVMIRSPDICGFTCGTIEGQYIKGSLNILAIKNRVPHNGHFVLFIAELCRLSRLTGQPARILNFINPRFEKHCLAMEDWEKCQIIMPDGIIEGVQYVGK